MLDKTFLFNFHRQLDAMTSAQVEAKIESVQKLQRTFLSGTEAELDARYLIKRLRRALADKAFAKVEH